MNKKYFVLLMLLLTAACFSGKKGDESNIKADCCVSDTQQNVLQDKKILDGDGKITLSRQNTEEKITVQYRKSDGSYDKESIDKIRHIMRSDDGTEHEISPFLIEFADSIEDHFGKEGLVVLEGYRKPDNESDKNLSHSFGQGMNISIPGISAEKIFNYASEISKKHNIGGVGGYKSFVHIDAKGKYSAWTFSKKKHAKKRKTFRVRNK